VEAGEHAGALESLLTRSQPTRKNRGPEEEGEEGAVLPAPLLVVAVIVTVVLLLFVIPAVRSLYKGIRRRPAWHSRRAVINISKFHAAQRHFHGDRARPGRIRLHLFQKRSKAMREFLDRCRQVPVIGPILNKAAIARYARTLSTMFSAACRSSKRLNSVAGATGNIVYEKRS